MRILLPLLLLISIFGVVPAQGANLPFSGVLGAGAVVQAQTEIPGTAGAVAVTYSSGGWHLGVVVPSGGRYSLEWHRGLSGTPVRLNAPGPAGVFRALDKSDTSKGGTLYAYELVAGHVRSAIHHDPSGAVRGGDGIVLHPDGFTVRQPDGGHTGSVTYRFATRYTWSGGAYVPGSKVREPALSKADYPVPSGWATTTHGDTILIKLAVADTEPLREQGLMGQTALDSDSGMLFAWGAETHDSFWMQDTPTPLSIAFLGQDGTVQEIQDMQAETTDLHTPRDPYWYAIEANLGFFAANGIAVGDTIHLQLHH